MTSRNGGDRRMHRPPYAGIRVVLVLLCAMWGATLPLACAPDDQRTLAIAAECGWNMELSKHTLDDLNVAAPDTAAAYWTRRYRVKPGLSLKIEGHFPDARYFSFNTYDSRFRSFSTNGITSSIADYQIEPNPDNVNPWRQAGPPGGSYTINVGPHPSPDVVNALPLAPAGTEEERDGFLIFRVYKPGGDPAAVDLPKVTVTSPTGTQTFASCTNQDKNFGAAIKRLPRAGKPLPDHDPDSGFARINAGGMSAFANVDNAYVKYLFAPPPAGQVLVVRGKAPIHPAGDHPTPWPRPGVDVRYFSMCSYPSIFPAPLTRNRMANGSIDYGCRNDEQTKLDSEGYYTYIVGTAAQRSEITGVPEANFVPLSTEHPGNHFLLLRNLLPNSDFGGLSR